MGGGNVNKATQSSVCFEKTIVLRESLAWRYSLAAKPTKRVAHESRNISRGGTGRSKLSGVHLEVGLAITPHTLHRHRPLPAILLLIFRITFLLNLTSQIVPFPSFFTSSSLSLPWRASPSPMSRVGLQAGFR